MPTDPPIADARYWRHVTDNARAIHTDGCTLVKDFYVLACWEHDLHYRTGRNWLGEDVGYWWSNRRLGTAIRYFSILHGWSLLAVTRFLGTTLGGWIAWIRYRRRLGRTDWPLPPESLDA